MAPISDLVSDLQHSSIAPRIQRPDSEQYEASLSSYFSQQEQSLRPASIVIPQSAQEVADIVKVIAKHHGTSSSSDATPCFAVRGGGRTPQAGWANVEAGVTMDLSAMKEVIPSDDRKTVRVGAGARWGDVYPVLDAINLAISGGRDSTVGVGGLTLGGGLSLFGPQRGFVCDDVDSFEVVLADASIVEASETSHPDLWRALKGGSSNFGIVTSFNFKSFDFGDIWGGQNIWSVDTYSQHLDALFEFTANPRPDPHATVITSFAIYQGRTIVNEGLKYTKPVDNPTAFKDFLAIPGSMYSSNKICSMTDAAIEQSGFNKNGRRQALLTTTFVNTREVLEYAFQAWKASNAAMEKLNNVQWSTTFQPLPRAITQKGIEFGGNVLGLEGAPDLINHEIAISWTDAKDDEFLVNTALSILADVDRFAKAKNADHRFVYLNYAWSSQDPIASYGPENVAFLKHVSERYDPQGLFQTGLAGGFKLSGCRK